MLLIEILNEKYKSCNICGSEEEVYTPWTKQGLPDILCRKCIDDWLNWSKNVYD